MEYREKILKNLRKKLASRKRETTSFRLDTGINTSFKKLITKDQQIGVIIENLQLEFIARQAGELK